MGELIAIASGKGGTGKTSLCAGIATALASAGERVLCIDCDIGLRNLDISLGMTDSGALSFLDVCSGNYELSQAARHPAYPTLAFLTAPVNCAPEEIDRDAFLEMLRKARSQFDRIFLDAPAGIDAGFRLCSSLADRVILVTGADPASIRDAQRAGTLLEQMGKKNIRIIVNRITKQLLKTIHITVDDVMDDCGLPLLGIVPDDPEVVLSAAFQTPLLNHTDTGAAAACRRIAKRIQGRPVPIPRRKI